MTLQTLHSQVKVEARVQGTNELDEFVYDTIREVHDQHTERQRYDELLVVNVPIPLQDYVDNYELPADFQHLKEVRFGFTNDNYFRELPIRGEFHAKRGTWGHPRFFEKTGTSIRLFPYGSIKTGMGLQIDYYKTATLDNASEMPVKRLVPVVKREVIARVHIFYKEMQSATAFQQLSKEAIIGSQGRTTTGN